MRWRAGGWTVRTPEKARFPLENVEQVRSRVRALLKENDATALVSSAACGADLIGLAEAGRFGLKRKVILPFDRVSFRATSVDDRPGEWGALYDQIIDAVEAAGDLITLRSDSDDAAYSAASRAILDRAVAMGRASEETATAVLIWDGTSRGDHDMTEEFGTEARRRGLAVVEILTI